MENVYLVHHGIKGMKWGHRRYQNKDGSLTKAGQRRYNKEKARLEGELKKVKQQGKTKAKLNKLKQLEDEIEIQKKKNASGDTDATPKTKTKSVKDMTDDEIRSAIARKQLEKQYSQLYPEQVSKGEAFMKTVTNDMLIPALKTSGKKAAESLIDNAIKKYTKDTIDPKSVEGMKKEIEKLKVTKELKDLKEGKEPFSETLKKAQDEAAYEKAKWTKEEFAEKTAARAKKNAEAAKETVEKAEDVEIIEPSNETRDAGRSYVDDLFADYGNMSYVRDLSVIRHGEEDDMDYKLVPILRIS